MKTLIFIWAFIFSQLAMSYPIGLKGAGLTTKYPALIDFGFIKPTSTGSTVTISSLGASVGDTLALGGTLTASTILDVQSTTAAFAPPRMTATQKNAIATPSAGMIVYDTTNTAPSYYNGATWQNLTQTLTTRSWSGYHAADCSFSVTSTTYAAFSSDATCTFTQQTNLNFGTVTSALSAGNAIPGIVFTPAETGQYRICALVGAFGATTGQGYGIEMLDNASALVASSYIQQAVGSYSEMFPLCGILNVTSTAAQTITLLGKGSSGALTIGSVDPTIFWNINLIH